MPKKCEIRKLETIENNVFPLKGVQISLCPGVCKQDTNGSTHAFQNEPIIYEIRSWKHFGKYLENRCRKLSNSEGNLCPQGSPN